jgi:hypothetical protein
VQDTVRTRIPDEGRVSLALGYPCIFLFVFRAIVAAAGSFSRLKDVELRGVELVESLGVALFREAVRKSVAVVDTRYRWSTTLLRHTGESIVSSSDLIDREIGKCVATVLTCLISETL